MKNCKDQAKVKATLHTSVSLIKAMTLWDTPLSKTFLVTDTKETRQRVEHSGIVLKWIWRVLETQYRDQWRLDIMVRKWLLYSWSLVGGMVQR